MKLSSKKILPIAIFLAVVLLGTHSTAAFGSYGSPGSSGSFGYQQTSSKQDIDVKLQTVPTAPKINEETKLKIDFINPQTQAIQPHIDYTVSIEKDAKKIFETQITHTSTGSVTIPITLAEAGSFKINIGVQGILFSPIPTKSFSFTIKVADT